MKKCKGCGQELQFINKDDPGYALNENQDYCQRCFRLTHYGDIDKLINEKIDNNAISNIYNNFSNDIFVLIVDIFDALTLDSDNLLDYFINKNVFLIINKLDLLPFNVVDDKITKEIIRTIKKTNFKFKDIILTHKNDQHFNDLFFNTLKVYKTNKVVFAGRVNAGKSTIINKLIGKNDLTVSLYPGTTIAINEISFNEYTFIDTPGLIDEESFINKINKSYISEIVPNKCINPRVYQLYDYQSYFIEGLIRIDIKPDIEASLTFYIKNELNIHRTKFENGDNFINKHINEMSIKVTPIKYKTYKVNDKQMFYIKGLGYFKVNGKSSIRIGINSDIKIFRSEVNL